MKRQYDKRAKLSGIVLIVIAAIVIEAFSLFRYWTSRNIMEEGIEKNVFARLIASALRVQEVLVSSEEAIKCEIWHVNRHLNDPDYMFQLAQEMVRYNDDNIIGAGMSFKPYYFPSKGKLFQPYANMYGDSIYVRQVASESHDYTKKQFYQAAIKGDTLKWSDPYLDKAGAGVFVTSYVLPIRDKNQTPIGAIGIDLETNWIGKYVNMNRQMPSSFSIVLTEDGELVAGPGEKDVSKARLEKVRNMINDSTVEKVMKVDNRIHSFTFYDDELKEKGHVYYARKLRAPFWRVAVVCYDKEMFRDLDVMQRKMALMALVGLLLMAFIVQRFIHYLTRLKVTQMSQERISGELKIANSIQQALLPTIEDQTMPDMSNVRVEGRLIPAKEVGGDLYNAFIRDGKLFFCIGDVSGKGIPSALIMAITQTLFRNIATHESNPAHIMSQLNTAACRNNKTNVFVTLFIGVIDMPTGHFRYCNAGHEIPLLINTTGDKPGDSRQPDSQDSLLLPASSNLPIGLFEGFNYALQSIELKPGSTLFLYTDGLTEARSSLNQLFGRERVIEMISHIGTNDPKQIVENVIADVNKFAGNAEQSDDLTLLAICYTPTEEQYDFDESLTLHNNVNEVKTLSTFIKDVMTRLNIDKSLASELRLALEEAVVNVIDYAYPVGTTGDVNIRVTYGNQLLKFVITDSGISFNPTDASTADTTLSAEDRPVGGLGIFLLRNLVDSINYERTDGKNVLTMIKKIQTS